MEYLIHICILVGIAAMLGLSYNLIAGYAGLLAICYAGFYGIGAYTAALLSLKLGCPFFISLIGAVFVCIASGLLIGWPSLSIKDDDFVIATFAFQVLIVSLLQNLVDFTGGPMGLPDIPEPRVLGWTISNPAEYLAMVFIWLGILIFITSRIGKSPLGRVLQAIREDEIFAGSLGKDVASFKLRTFVLSAALTAIPGVIHAYYISFIDPSSFTVMESVFVISIVVVGGAGSLRGPIVGAVILVVLPEMLRFIGMPISLAANMRQILYGGALVGFMLLRPKGIMGNYTFGQKGRNK